MVAKKMHMQCKESPHTTQTIKQRNPVILIPPLEGSWIESKFDTSMGQPDTLCRRSRAYWKQFWLPDLMLFKGDDAICWAAGASLGYDKHTGGYSYPTGAQYRVNMAVASMCSPIGMDGKSQRSGKRAAFCAYECICKKLEELGYVQGHDLLAMPYDWRLGPQNWFKNNPKTKVQFADGPGRVESPLWGYFSQLKIAIEHANRRAVAERGTQQSEISSNSHQYAKTRDGRVMLVGFSLSCPLLRLFLAEYVSAQWKRTFVAGFFSLSGVFSGSLTTLPNLLSTRGQEFHLGVPAEVQDQFRNMFRSWGSLLWMVALKGAAGSTPAHNDSNARGQKPYHAQVVKIENGRQYTVDHLDELFRDAGVLDAVASLQDMAALNLLDGRAAPGVDTWIVHGSGHDTPSSYTFPATTTGSGNWDAAPIHTEFEMGDNTATFNDLRELPLQWARESTAKVTLHHFAGVRHDLTVREPRALELLEQVLRNVSGSTHRRP
jgi:hypothetical protein